MNSRYIIYALIPVISALIGWVTNYLAVKMIFHPRKEINIFGIKIIGLIPKRKNDLAIKIAETVEKELISHKDIQNVVSEDDFQEKILEVLIEKIEDFLQSILGQNPLMAMMLNGDVADKIKDMIRLELKKKLPDIIESIFESVESKLDFKNIIQNKIEGFDLLHLEEIIYSIASQELKAIEIIGGVLGFTVGIVQILILSLTA